MGHEPGEHGVAAAGRFVSPCPSARRAGGRATKAGVSGQRLEILAPLVDLTKADIIRLGLDLGLDFGLTTSCYDPDAAGRPCGACDSCRLRAAGFAAAGAADPRARPA